MIGPMGKLCFHVAFMLHGIAARRCKPLKHNGNACNTMQHELGRWRFKKYLLFFQAYFAACRSLVAGLFSNINDFSRIRATS